MILPLFGVVRGAEGNWTTEPADREAAHRQIQEAEAAFIARGLAYEQRLRLLAALFARDASKETEESPVPAFGALIDWTLLLTMLAWKRRQLDGAARALAGPLRLAWSGEAAGPLWWIAEQIARHRRWPA